MVILISILSGMLGAEILLRIRQVRKEQLKPVQNVVRKVGPALYSKVSKRIPLHRTESDLWKKEQENHS
jgi:hypothetical protein